MAQKSPFPQDVRVLVVNENPDLDFTDVFDSVEYRFPPGEVIAVPAEVAWFIFAFETRPDPKTGEPRAFRDKHGRHDRDLTHYQQRLVRLGWSNDPQKRRWFDNFKFKVQTLKTRYTKAEFAAVS
jgi:hypothetical protein